MYDYVRRQQELQPGIFATKTFHWMDQSSREPSWTRMYTKNAPLDPLIYSSSSLYAAPRAAPKPGGARSALQRSASGISPHRALFALRRHRQHSDVPIRPPSGVSGTFTIRKRGKTVPHDGEPPAFASAVQAAVPQFLQFKDR
ncbi:hypothetical protein GGF37_001155 [Kickxella alabastrina]|nr:hypothetical protein GGF37_001155 [Kickxella alabastrina]